jgi:hypothetical protein
MFGDPARLAIEVRLDRPTPEHLFGFVCLWAANRAIGDLDAATIVSVAAGHFERTLAFSGRRRSPVLEGLSGRKALELVFDALYTDTGGSLEDLRRSTDENQRFEICPGGGEPFDGEKAILIETDGYERFIWQNFRVPDVFEVKLRRGEYAAVVTEFVRWENSLRCGRTP